MLSQLVQGDITDKLWSIFIMISIPTFIWTQKANRNCLKYNYKQLELERGWNGHKKMQETLTNKQYRERKCT